MKKLHPRNIHNQDYDFSALTGAHPDLVQYIVDAPESAQSEQKVTINFANPSAVKALNTALLNLHYGVKGWDIPEDALCPPIPGRVDYIHHIADLIGEPQPNGKRRLLDIGTGANGIYPLLAASVYGWQCVGSDISEQSIENVTSILSRNPQLSDQISLRLQEDKHKMFEGVISEGEYFDVSVCNPPFHSSAEEALRGSRRKVANLNKNKPAPKGAPKLNFGGMENELWCNGGEALFLKKMIKESKSFAKQVGWFTSLVSKSENLKSLQKLANKSGATDIRVIDMEQGNKRTRILAWTFQQIN
jgi:23S rRNA (adenine1618-N6)-methyltransferase